MSDEGTYVPGQSDMVIFDRPPSGAGQRRVFRVAGHDAQAGMTTFIGLPSPLSAHEMADLGAKNVQVLRPEEVEPDWAGAGRRLFAQGAGGRPKIYQLAELDRGARCRMVRADEQAALALAQRAADEAGQPILLAQTHSGELIIGSQGALEAVGEGLGTHTLLTVQPGLAGSGGGSSLRQARELLSSDQARDAVASALASVSESSASLGVVAADAVLRAITDTLPPEEQKRLTIPGWQYREELMPEVAEAAAQIEASPDARS
jgi:hypothetical protein